MKAGVIGLGDMGSGLAKNLIANGFETSGFDVSDARMAQFAELGGVSCADAGACWPPCGHRVRHGDERGSGKAGDPW